jgi:hypothetical protein
VVRWLVINDPAEVHRIAGMTIDRMAPPTAMIAIHQIRLAAPAIGLGTTNAGRITGATNIPVTFLFQSENLAKLPKNQTILVVCASGTSAAMSTSVPNLLGYDAWQLRFGMTSWRDKTATSVWSTNPEHLQDIFGGNYLTEPWLH